jgi:hypothetical protein
MKYYDFMVLPFVEIEIRLGTLGKTFDSSIDKKYFEKIKDHLDTGDWESINNKNTIEYCKNNNKLITENDDISFLILKENVLKEDFQINTSPFDIRYSINQEFKFSTASIVNTFDKNDSILRNKTRKSYLNENFRYDLTIVNEISNNINKTKYEIEIELIINNNNITWSPNFINDFLECKIYDLVNIVEPLERNKFKINLIKEKVVLNEKKN